MAERETIIEERANLRANIEREKTNGPGAIAAESGWGDPDRPRSTALSAFLKIPTRSSRRLVILSSQPLLYTGHYVNGFMQPHFTKNCPHCDYNRIGTQDRLVFHCWDPNDKVGGLLELPGEPGSSGMKIHFYSNESGFLRSLIFDFHKEGGLKNGKILPTPSGAWPNIGDLPVEIDLLPEMKKLWAKHSNTPL